MCFTIAWHAFSHLRHSSAHAFMCLSSGNFSHALPHSAHVSAQAEQMIVENGPPLATICAVNLADAATPDGSALRTSVAGLVTDLVRDDAGGVRSYLLHCERSSGQYLFDSLLDAGAGHGIDPDGFPADGAAREASPTT